MFTARLCEDLAGGCHAFFAVLVLLVLGLSHLSDVLAEVGSVKFLRARLDTCGHNVKVGHHERGRVISKCSIYLLRRTWTICSLVGKESGL